MTGVDKTRVLRVVTLASASGKYGGPTDTAIRQSELANSGDIRTRVLSGAYRGDARVEPQLHTVRVRSPRSLGHRAAFSLSFARELIRQTRSADVVHVSIAREMIPVYASVVAILLRKPLVIQPHGMLTSRRSRVNSAIDLVIRPIVRRADRVIALTERERDELELLAGTVARDKTAVIGNPSPEVQRNETATTPRLVFFAARLHPRKRVRDLIEAARITGAQGYPYEYLIAGPDEGDGAFVTAAAHELPNVRYLGAISAAEVEETVSEAGVFVLPSHSEPWGNVVATAIKCGVPVIVTDSAALAGDIERLRVGRVVPDNSPRALAAAIDDVLGAEGAAGHTVDRQGVEERFGNSGIARQLIDVYETAAGRGSR